MPQEGDKFGSYRLVRLLGTGGFAEVWLGEHELMLNEAAIKILHLQLPTLQEREKFLDEARYLASFSHPNIVRVLDCGMQNNIPFLVLEYAPNGTLRMRHPRGSKLLPEVVVAYVQQIAAGLQYAHDRRLIHRDVKPENILLGKNYQMLVSDFGVAAVAQTISYQKTQDIRGTASYMAPEQFEGRPAPASDQYALGIMVYEWLCGTLPFQGTPLQIPAQQRLKRLSLRDKVPSLSSAFEQAVLTALSVDLNQRFRDIQEFADALAQALKDPHDPANHAQGAAPHQSPAWNAGPPPLDPAWMANAQGAGNNPPPSPVGMANTPPGDPWALNQPGAANNPVTPTWPVNANNPFAGAPPLAANDPSSPLHNAPTIPAQSGTSPFSPFSTPSTSTGEPKKPARWLDFRGALGFKNRLFLFGGGIIDFILAVVLALWLHAGDLSWDLWLGSLVYAWGLRFLCASISKKYLAVPLALFLAFYWFLGGWAFGTLFDAVLHVEVVPPHIIAILSLLASAIVHLLYANKKR